MANPAPACSRAVVMPVRVLAVGSLLATLVVVPGGVAAARIDGGGAFGAPVPPVAPAAASAPRHRDAATPPAGVPARAAGRAGGEEAGRAVGSTGVRAGAPAFADRLPARTRQVIRTVSSRRWCARRWCTKTQAWRKRDDGRWDVVRVFRSTIGPNGFGKRREGDLRSPSGVYRITVTFSTGPRAPGPMPWRRRLPTSIVTSDPNRLYNTWVEQRWRSDGDRPAMRFGFVVDYNHPRLRVGVGPRPVIGRGSGILYHTSRPGQRWVATAGCTQVGNPRSMRWIVRWLDPQAHPRVVQDL